MKKVNVKHGFLFLITALILSCDSGPKVIEAVESTDAHVHQNDEQQVKSSKDELHEVFSKEVLHTDKYTYINVTEGDSEQFWVAMPKNENARVGEKYYYRGGLFKKNFQSKEFDRVFETLYLVSEVRTQPFVKGINHSGSASGDKDAGLNTDKEGGNNDVKIEHNEGVTKISELVKNMAAYKGKVVRVIGKCSKINPQIMGKNWVHLEDGTADDFDFIVTTQENLMPGMIVTMEGVIATNKDFGAGYKYEIILEEGKVIGH